MKLGDKFSVATVLDVEILGYFPAGEQRDGKAKYLATVNGYKMMAGQDFLDNLEQISKETKKGGKKSGRK